MKPAYIKWWKKKSQDYPFTIRTKISIKPEEVDDLKYGPFASVVLVHGERTWGFITDKCRQTFIKDYQGFIIK